MHPIFLKPVIVSWRFFFRPELTQVHFRHMSSTSLWYTGLGSLILLVQTWKDRHSDNAGVCRLRFIRQCEIQRNGAFWNWISLHSTKSCASFERPILFFLAEHFSSMHSFQMIFWLHFHKHRKTRAKFCRDLWLTVRALAESWARFGGNMSL